MRTPTIAFAALIVLMHGPAIAERADREKEIVINADRVTTDDKVKTSELTGTVIVTQGTMRITAARTTIRKDAEGYTFYVAYGSPVTFRQKRDKVDEYVDGEAQRAEFDDKTDVLKLFTKAKVKGSQNEITGEFISYDMRSEVADVQGAPPGTTPPPNTRVKVIITPPPKKPDDKAVAEKNPPLKLKSEAETK